MEINNFIAGQLDLAQMTAAQPSGSLTPAGPGQSGEKTRAELHKAGQEFESYFISYLIKNMRETIPKGLLDRKGEQVWYSFYDQEISRLATQAGGIGLTAFVDAYAENSR
ncbi:MAG: putative Peptidoglycan hydrolase FlgJ [Nitrospira sp.]|jgi:flagellar protein FlgJ|nr:putative Peptidoglycan hydrolase FlgJ [Nitrospira sp.]